MNTKSTYIFENFDGVSPISGNRGIQDTRYIYDMNFSLVSTTSQPQDESTIDKSNTNQHSSSHITNQMFKSKHKSQTEFMQEQIINM